MSERFSVRKWLAGSMGLASGESPENRVAFMVIGSLEMGNVCMRDTTTTSQCTVSRTPEICNYT